MSSPAGWAGCRGVGLKRPASICSVSSSHPGSMAVSPWSGRRADMAGGLGYVGVGVVAYLFFLVAGVPAALVLQHTQWPDEVGWDQARGTVWVGGVQGPWWRGVRLESLEWRFRPWRLALGEAAVQARLAAPGLELTGDVEIGRAS